MATERQTPTTQTQVNPPVALPADHESRGLLAGVDVALLQRKIQTPPYDRLWRFLVERWQETEQRRQANGGLLSYSAVGSYSVSPAVIDAALIWRLTGAAQALAFVEDSIGQLCAAWSGPENRPQQLRDALPDGTLPYLSHAEVPLAADICRAGLSPAARAALTQVLREHVLDCHDGGRALLMYSSGCNIPVVRNINAAIAALVWGEDVGHPNWRQIVELGRDAALGYCRRGLDAQGFPFEGPAYAGGTVHHIYLLAQLLKQRGWADLFLDEPNTQGFIDALLSLLVPDRDSFGAINDVGKLSPWTLPFLLLTARYFQRPDHLGLWYEFQGPDHPSRPYGDALPAREKLTGGQWLQGWHVPSCALTLLWWDAQARSVPVSQTPLPTALYSEGTETAAFRTSWGKDAVFLSFHGGGRSHSAAGHAHSDAGHFSLWAYGDDLAIDTGRYNVDEDQHNTLLVDGQCYLPCGSEWGFSRRAGRLFGFQRHSLLDYVCCDMAAMKDCVWAQRHLLFVRIGGDESYQVVIDNINKDHKKHTYWWQLHTGPENRIALGPEQRAVIHGPHSRLDMTFVIPSPLDFPQDPNQLLLRTDQADWVFGKGGPREQYESLGLGGSSVCRPRLIAQVTGLNGELLAVLSPRKNGQPALEIRDHSVRRIKRLEITHGGGVDTLIAALDHGYINLPDARGFAELAVVRRDRSGRIIGSWSLGGRVDFAQQAWS